MATSAINVFSGISAAVAGLAGDKVSKTGTIPGLDLATILPAMLGKSGGTSSLLGTLASVATKSGLLNTSNLADLAGSLFSLGKAGAAKKTDGTGIAGLAAAIAGNSGKAADLGSIATMATSLAKTAKDSKGLTGIATELGKTLSSANGISFSGGAAALKGLGSVVGGDVKGELLTAVLKGLSK